MIPRVTSARCFFAALLSFTTTGAATAQLADERCLDCHSQAAIVLIQVEFGDGEAVTPFIDDTRFLQSAHGQLSCKDCHDNCHPEFQEGFEASNHPPHDLPTRREYALAIDQKCRSCHESGDHAETKMITDVLHPIGKPDTPLCADCHQPHSMSKVQSRGESIDLACAKCHEDVYEQYTGSVHGGGLATPANQDLPKCTSCHLGHAGGGKSQAARRVWLARPCMGCHGDQQLMERYDISTEVVRTYLNDFHGVSVKFNGTNGNSPEEQFTLVCADCHGIHGVTSASGIAASELKAQLQNVCRKCHEDASANFASAWLSHSKPSLSSNVLVYLVKVGYTVLIPFVITGLIIHIVSHLIILPLRKRTRAATAHSTIPESHADGRTGATVPDYFVRFTVRQRAEHLIVLTTFVLLIVTGLPQKFHDSTWAETAIRTFGGIESTRLIHRVAGVALTAVSLIHLVTVAALVLLRKTRMTMVPTRKDFEDVIGTLKHHLGFSDRAPQADRFTYGEKFEYWGMILGTVVMVVSGFVLLYPTLLTQYLPGQLVAASKVAHSYEAMMALLTIVIWHMYGARFDPCIFTGKISRERLAHHHPLEYERLVRAMNTRSDAQSA